jgi:hypothetical protein
LLTTKEADILAAVGSSNAATAKTLLAGIKQDVNAIDAAVKAENRKSVVAAQVAAFEKVSSSTCVITVNEASKQSNP